jgi:hypothetical protein
MRGLGSGLTATTGSGKTLGAVPLLDAAVDAGVPLHVFLSWLTRSGCLLVVEADPECWLPEGWESHNADCRCVLAPIHPDIQPV